MLRRRGENSSSYLQRYQFVFSRTRPRRRWLAHYNDVHPRPRQRQCSIEWQTWGNRGSRTRWHPLWNRRTWYWSGWIFVPWPQKSVRIISANALVMECMLSNALPDGNLPAQSMCWGPICSPTWPTSRANRWTWRGPRSSEACASR